VHGDGLPAPAILVTDGAGGAIVAWGDDRSGASDVYARRITSAGVPQWAADGVALCTATGNQYLRAIESDGSGGAILCWEDNRGADTDIYARRITVASCRSGPPTASRCAPRPRPTNPLTPTTDGAGGAIMTWEDNRTLQRSSIARRINSAGTPLWAADGRRRVRFLELPPVHRVRRAGGAVIALGDGRTNVSYDVYAQRVNGSGVNHGRLTVSRSAPRPSCRADPPRSSDGANGAVVVWVDLRYDPINQNEDLFSRRNHRRGRATGLADGAPRRLQPGRQVSPVLVSDNASGAIVAWQDGRGRPAGTSMHTASVRAAATVAVHGASSPRTFGLGPPWPNPMHDGAELRLRLPERAAVRLDVYDLQGRHVRQLLAGNTRPGGVTLRRAGTAATTRGGWCEAASICAGSRPAVRRP
jgi:hypothetical protein